MKYETAVPLGRGGMGEVYKAYDPALGRLVALKYLRWNDPELVERFQREARLQARVDHPNVCQVYEVGVDGGRPYIAMQYVEGTTLDVAAAGMTLVERVAVVRDVAEAVHVAHEIGLIHRDLKPQNVMVERTGDVLRPYVMDFGLARESAGEGLTATGALVGTPAYMAPEQARGERGLDRRVDVYGLGAVLYRVLTGHAPFEGVEIDVAVKVAHADPTPPRRLDASIPAELETIVLKCLEKERERRYASARDLALDLGRFLAGEPVEARPASWARRIARRLRRNRTVATVAAAAIVAVVLLSGQVARGRWDARARAESALRFGQEAERIESALRQAYLLPLHDTRVEKKLVRARMAQIEKDMAQIGAPASGPGHYALGRGSLVLDDLAAARSHLEAAWAAGYRTPDAASALGQTFGRLYERALRDLGTLDARARELRRGELARDLRDPGLQYLRLVAPDVASATYLDGLIAFYEGRHDEAIAKAEKALADAPMLYEAGRLLAEAHLAIASERREKGDVDGALDAYRQSGRAYQAALDVARSDPRIYEGECLRNIQLLQLESSRGRSPREPFEQALGACERAIRADSGSDRAYQLECLALWRWAELHRSRGEDPGPTLLKSIAAGQEAVRLNPRNAQAFGSLGNAYSVMAETEMGSGVDPRDELARAIAMGEKAVALEPGNAAFRNNLAVSYLVESEQAFKRGLDSRLSLERAIVHLEAAVRSGDSEAHSSLGLAWLHRGEFEAEHGIDPRPSLERAVASYQAALAVNPQSPDNSGMLGSVFGIRGEYESLHGIDPGASFEAGVAALHRAVELNPTDPLLQANLGELYRLEADHALAAGGAPLALVAQSVDWCTRAARIDPHYAAPRRTIAGALYAGGLRDLRLGRDPRAALDRAAAEAREAVRLDPSEGASYVTLVRVELAAARGAAAHGRDPAGAFERADSALRKGTASGIRRADLDVAEALLRLQRAEWRLSRRGPPADDVARGLAATEAALSLSPGLAEANALAGALHVIQARQAPGEARGAETLLRQALESNPSLRADYQPYLEEARRLATMARVADRPPGEAR